MGRRAATDRADSRQRFGFCLRQRLYLLRAARLLEDAIPERAVTLSTVCHMDARGVRKRILANLLYQNHSFTPTEIRFENSPLLFVAWNFDRATNNNNNDTRVFA